MILDKLTIAISNSTLIQKGPNDKLTILEKFLNIFRFYLEEETKEVRKELYPEKEYQAQILVSTNPNN
jgi:hypothetical protein